jgi:hypothetical protein
MNPNTELQIINNIKTPLIEEPHKYHAFVGPRDLSGMPEEKIDEYKQQVHVTCAAGTMVRTGAAPGADQLSADSALYLEEKVSLCLPWKGYQKEWRRIIPRHLVEELIFDESIHKEAADSVDKYHPNPLAVKSNFATFHLMGRNYLIMVDPKTGPVGRVVALCYLDEQGKPKGGTGQAIRIAEALGIPTLLIHP